MKKINQTGNFFFVKEKFKLIHIKGNIYTDAIFWQIWQENRNISARMFSALDTCHTSFQRRVSSEARTCSTGDTKKVGSWKRGIFKM